jgi:ribonuclease H / adenosylcobalamin/alpha-ribazole phosphatase
VARKLAEEAAREHIGIEIHDVDVALSAQGREQALAVGRWFGGMAPDERPNMVLVSPYRRAVQTAQAICEAAGIEVSRADGSYVVDERLREKEFGVLTGLTRAGIASLHPNEYELRMLFGKFYHRPPGGESWVDVIFRLRALMDTVSLHYSGRRVMIVAHQVVVLCLRYVIENLSEAEILAIDREGDVANCAITEYRFDPAVGRDGNLVLARYNVTAPMEAEATPVTDAPDKMVAARG